MRSPRRGTLALLASLAAAFLAPAARAEEAWQRLPVPAAAPAPVASGTAPVNDIRMFYAVHGEGPPVILLHGGLGTAEAWGNQIPALAARHRVVVAESRGHGRSTRSGQPFGYELMASDVLALMDHLAIPRAAIVGWSDGGIIGLGMAMRHPERVERVFAFGANVTPDGVKPDVDKDPVFGAYIERAGKDYERLSPTPGEYASFVDAIAKMWATQPNYTPEQLARIKAPVVIAQAEHDEAIRREHAELMARQIPGARLLVMPGVSHFAMWQQPEAFNRAVLDFLAGG